MKLATIMVFLSALPISAGTGPLEGTVQLGKTKLTIEEAFGTITHQLGYDIFYNYDELDVKAVVEISDRDMKAEDLLRIILGNSYTYRVIDNSIVISPVAAKNGVLQQQQQNVTISGRILTAGGSPLVGATILVKSTIGGSRPVGTTSDVSGAFRITAPALPGVGVTLVCSYIGYETREVVYQGEPLLEIRMAENAQAVEEVVITGMFTRKEESFTGSAITFKQEDLKRVGNQNLIASLKNLDPSFIVTESLEFGSDPNRMPEITMRGRTTVPNLREEYTGNPNQPLFILDGFETTLETIYDLDMNRVSSITLLKDAAAKAIYGSKAGNGVVVIESVLPKSGNLYVSYTGSVDITAPDLTSYNLANSAEKLQAEWMSGKYESDNSKTQAEYLDKYYHFLKEVDRGVDTYWLSKPLRTGVGQKHSVSLSGGDTQMRYDANVSYNDTKGAMKGSDRQTFSGGVNLSYRYRNLSFRNNLSISTNRGENSPYGSFSDFARMNPYLRTHDENGNMIKAYYHDTTLGQPNPLYNGTLDVVDKTTYTTITENFYAEWSILENLRITGKLGVTKSFNDSDRFYPADHTKFAGTHINSENYLDRGEYAKSNAKSLALSAEVGLSYLFQKNRHLIHANALWNIETSDSESTSIAVIGFPSPLMDYISAGNKYSGTKPGGTESTTRSIGLVGSLNYSYDNRYLFDFSYRATASSQFGANNRWGHFWSVGLGWNIHKEKFMESLDFIDLFKIRGSLGYTGSQNFSAYMAIATYTYFMDMNYGGDMGVYLMGLANPNLKWQQQYDRNVGADLTLFDRVTLRFDYYSNRTTNLLTDVTVAPSAGFTGYKENLGEMENTGYQASAQVRIVSNPQQRFSVNVFGGIAHNKNTMVKISDSLRQLNESQEESQEWGKDNFGKPVTRFEEGKSMTTLWAVRSMGIDPVTGREVFMKKDGTLTMAWNAEDQVKFGDTEPKLTGNLGANMEYKGFTLNLSFNFKYGGQMYNSTLVDKIENVNIASVNVDKRVLYDRWSKEGDEAKYKSIRLTNTTNVTSRFVEDLNEFVFSSVSLAYDFSDWKFIRKSPIDRLRASFNMNDIGRISTVKQERGTEYPFARAFSFSISASF